MINRNAYHNAMRCGTLLSTPRPDAQHGATPLVASQRNNLFFINAPNRYAALGPSTLLSDLFVINASLRDETQRYSTPRNAFQLNDLFVTTQCLSSRLPAAHRASTRLNAAQRFVCLFTSLLNSTMRGETQRYSTQRNQPIGELNVPKITTNYKNMRFVS